MAEAQETFAGAAPRKERRDGHFSKDGKWKSFPKVPNLLQYVSTGTYFARVKVNGKLIRQSLETTVYTTARERLPDFLKRQKSAPVLVGTFGESLSRYRGDLDLDVALSSATKRYRGYCIKTILKEWPGLEQIPLAKLTAKDCKEWAKQVADKYDEQYFNNTLGTLRAVLRKAGMEGSNDPTRGIKRLGVKAKVLRLPTPEEFKGMIGFLERSSAWKLREAAVVIKFLAYSGCRISEAQKVKWADVDLENGFVRVHNAKLRNASNHATTRDLPIMAEMRMLLEDLRCAAPAANDRVLPFNNVERSLSSACKELKIERITHHDLRHMFATRAIQSGVDVATVAAWLGHKDGGALVLKTYSHFQRDHSLAMAAKVRF